MDHTGLGSAVPGGDPVKVCLIGMGPRGLSVLERLCANARHGGSAAPVTIHVVDPYLPGPGAVWRSDQNRALLMNTVASQVTMFTDTTVDMRGPLEPGPSLYEWASFLTLMGPFNEYPPHVLAEARALSPDSYATRSFYGHYLDWVYRRVVSLAPRRVRVRAYRSPAVALDDEGGAGAGGQRVLLADGTVLAGLHAVILVQGHLPAEPSAEECEMAGFAAAHGLSYVQPMNPADADLRRIRPGEVIGLRGLGLCFFDYVTLLTTGRGGRFERVDGRTVYHASGQEPRICAGSRRGVPYHARGENEKGAYGRHQPVVLTAETVTRLRARTPAQAGLDFRRDVWPLIAKEVETAYYRTLLTAWRCQCEGERFQRRYLTSAWGSAEEELVLAEFDIPLEQRFDWQRVAQPYRGQRFRGPASFRRWLLQYLEQDLAEARAGNISGPLKSALDVLRDLRNEIRLIVDHGGLTGRSHRDDLQRWYTPLNAFLSIGPPAQRIEEAMALVRAGVLEFAGPDVRVTLDPDRPAFVIDSPAVPGSAQAASTLIEARVAETDIRNTTDPLLRYLLATGQCRGHRIADPGGEPCETGGLDVTDRPYHLIGAAGRAHPRRFAFGVPTESVHWATAAGIRPGVNSVILTDSDAIARAVLALSRLPGPSPVAAQSDGRRGDAVPSTRR